ncbi:hypothetical protein [Xenorhabdus bovienii]|nr:hypothetical protein [Xenorhabdus bovienii]MCG3464173.1 hypothetical protein [Xenorhabdus bovienii]
MINPLVGSFCQCACIRLFNGGSGGGGFGLAGLVDLRYCEPCLNRHQ